MRKAILILSLLGISAMADETADRAAITRTVAAAMKSDGAGAAALPAPDFDGDLVTLPAARPWCELDCPRAAIGRIRFIAPDVALLEGTTGGDGVFPGDHFIAVMKKMGDDWRIASMHRVLPPAMPATR